MPKPKILICTLISVVLLSACNATEGKHLAAPEKGDWIRLFNGKDLEGWTVKIAGHDLDDNYGNTFCVKDGVLQVSYDKYGPFGRQFGSIYTQKTFSNYWLHVEYRIVGDQAPGSPDFSYKNSGIEIHSQAPETMTKDQEAPISLEMNLIAGGRLRSRLTGDVCRNGTRMNVNGKALEEKCGNSSTIGVRGNTWVTVEAQVRGGDSIKLYVNGTQVAEATQLELDNSDPIAAHKLAGGADKKLSEGRISLQSEGHPVEFRRVELLPLDSQ
jgi:hypothetical protein